MLLQTQNRMKLMADNYEDDHLKTAPDHTNHKPSPDQVVSPNHPRAMLPLKSRAAFLKCLQLTGLHCTCIAKKVVPDAYHDYSFSSVYLTFYLCRH